MRLPYYLAIRENRTVEWLFAWVVVLGGLSYLGLSVLDGLRVYHSVLFYPLVLVEGSCALLFPWLGWRLTWRAAARQPREGPAAFLRLISVGLLLVGIGQVLLLLFVMLLAQLDFSTPPNPGGDSFFG